MIKKSAVILLCLVFFANSTSPLITNAASKVMSYDTNGNILNDGEICYTYNDANRLKEVRKCTGNVLIAEYTYNFAGQRLSKKVYENGIFKYMLLTVNDIYDLKINADGTEEQTTYYKANDELIAHKTTKNGASTLSYHHNDHLGSASVVTNTTGAVVEETKYLPYGSVRAGGTESLTGRYQYTNQEKDSETNLIYYGARYYSPILGRFVQPDSMLPDIYDPQQLNRYAYVKNNPLKYTDPSGHAVIAIGGGIVVTLTTTQMILITGATVYVVSCYIDCERTNDTIIAVGGYTIEKVQQGTELAKQVGAVLITEGIDMGEQAVDSAKKALAGLIGAVSLFIDNDDGDDSDEENNNNSKDSNSSKRNPKQDKKLSDGEIKKLKDNGIEVHGEKTTGGKGASRYDIYKDQKGNLYTKPKGGQGPGEPMGININDF